MSSVVPTREPSAAFDVPVLTGLAFDAVVLAGGRSSRLGGVPKATLRIGDRTLVELAVAAAARAGAARIVVVGPAESLPSGAMLATAATPAALAVTREAPAFGGPAAALAAGVQRLATGGAPSPVPAAFTLVLACDQPLAEAALPALLEAAAASSGAEKGKRACASASEVDEVHVELPFSAASERGSVVRGGAEAWVGVDEGRVQPLLAVYETAALARAVRECVTARAEQAASREGALAGASMRSLLERLVVAPVALPPGSAADVDTWPAAERLGITDAGRDDAGRDEAGRDDAGQDDTDHDDTDQDDTGRERDHHER